MIWNSGCHSPALRLTETAASGRHGADARATDPLGYLIVHTGAGRKTKALADNPRVCIAVTADTAFVRGETPCQHGFTYRSVLVEGRATLVEENAGREQALRSLAAKYDRASAPESFEQTVLAQTLVYTIEIDTLAYKERPRSA